MEIFYKRKIKIHCKICVYLLSFVMLFCTVFSVYCQTVCAAQYLPGVIAGVSQIVAFYNAIGEVIGQGFAQAFYDEYKEQFDSIQGLINSDGTITFSEDAVKQLRAILDEYLASNPGAIDVVWIPVITEKDIPASWFSSTESYYKAMSVLNSHDLVGFYRSEYNSMLDFGCYVDENGKYATIVTDTYSYTPVYFDLSDFVIHMNTTSFNQTILNSVSYLTSVFGSDNTTNISSYTTELITQNGLPASPDWFGNLGKGWVSPSEFGYTGRFFSTVRAVYNPFYTGQLSSTANRFTYFVPVSSSESGIHFMPIFANVNAYKDWIAGNGSYYKFDSGYTGGDITINPDADYTQITDAIQNAMQQALQSGKNITGALSAMQSAFTKALGEISGTLGDIEDNTSAANEWLEKIYNKLVEFYGQDSADAFLSIDENLDLFLQRYLQIYGEDNDDMDAPFNQLVHNVKSMGELLLLLYDRNHDDIEHFELVIGVLIEAMITQQQESNSWLEKIYDRVDDIYDKVKAILFVDTVDTAVDIISKMWDSITEWIEGKLDILEMVTDAAGVGNIMKTKFPFSIPWDIYAILLMFDAPAKPPVISLHFEFPFIDYEYDYEYVMDDEMWVNLATFCRFFLTIGYEITLIHLTQKLYAAGLFDVPTVGKRKR